MPKFIVPLEKLSREDLAMVGGKGANLGELIAAGFPVPPGFCVTTRGFALFIKAKRAEIHAQLDQVNADDLESLRTIGARVRKALAAEALPKELKLEIEKAIQPFGKDAFFAVRSSATAEDLPSASFAGQQDTYLNVRPGEDLMEKIKGCFISLYTDRAILYRIQNGFEHRDVALSAVVQQLVPSEVAGIMFTADPISGRRSVISIDAGYGLGESLVSGLVSPDNYLVDKQSGRVISQEIATKEKAILPVKEGGTRQVRIDEARQTEGALRPEELSRLAELARSIEALFGSPQDIEWALADGELFITQSRPITSLFPRPRPLPSDDALHVYASISHFQMMVDPIPPLALSVLRTVIFLGRRKGEIEGRVLLDAAGRIYADFSALLRHPIGRRMMMRGWERTDPLAVPGLKAIAARPEFRQKGSSFNPLRLLPVMLPYLLSVLKSFFVGNFDNFSEEIVDLIRGEARRVEKALAEADDLESRFQLAIKEMQNAAFIIGRWIPNVAAGFLALTLINRIGRGRVAADDLEAITRGLSGNVATEMNLQVGDLGQTMGSSTALLKLFQSQELSAQQKIERAAKMDEGRAFSEQWHSFISLYGARALSELNLAEPRWSENPEPVLRMALNIALAEEAGGHRQRHEELKAAAERASQRIIASAFAAPLGFLRGRLVRRLLHVGRNLAPMREHHKFLVIKLLGEIKPVLIEIGSAFFERGLIDEAEDVWFLSLPEIQAALSGDQADLRGKIARRQDDYRHFAKLDSPHVITSEGEIPVARVEREGMPAGALPGVSASPGVVKGLAKVIRDPASDVLAPGEILIAQFTDPGWTPLFVNAAAVVTETGGIMSHGSLVAREYGIPAVVGVQGATAQIQSGEQIEVNGDQGYVLMVSVKEQN